VLDGAAGGFLACSFFGRTSGVERAEGLGVIEFEGFDGDLAGEYRADLVVGVGWLWGSLSTLVFYMYVISLLTPTF
jgi:hypothetical protein